VGYFRRKEKILLKEGKVGYAQGDRSEEVFLLELVRKHSGSGRIRLVGEIHFSGIRTGIEAAKGGFRHGQNFSRG